MDNPETQGTLDTGHITKTQGPLDTGNIRHRTHNEDNKKYNTET